MTLAQLAAIVLPPAAVLGLWLGWAPEGRRVLPAASESRPVEGA